MTIEDSKETDDGIFFCDFNHHGRVLVDVLLSSSNDLVVISSSDARFKTRCPVCIHGQTHGSPSEPSGAHPFTEKPTNGGEGKGVGVEREGRHQFCDAHPNGTDDPCRACGNARRAYDAATKAEKLKPTPTPPRASDYCVEHDWLLRSQCTEMEHRNG